MFSPISTLVNIRARLDLESLKYDTTKTPEILAPKHLKKETDEEISYDEPSMGELRCQLLQRMIDT